MRIESGVRGHSSSEDGGDESDHDMPLNARHGITWNAFAAMSDSEEFRTRCLCTSEHTAAGGQE